MSNKNNAHFSLLLFQRFNCSSELNYNKWHESRQLEFDCQLWPIAPPSAITPNKVATWFVLIIWDKMLKVNGNVINCCYYDKLATLREYPTAYFRAACIIESVTNFVFACDSILNQKLNTETKQVVKYKQHYYC